VARVVVTTKMPTKQQHGVAPRDQKKATLRNRQSLFQVHELLSKTAL